MKLKLIIASVVMVGAALSTIYLGVGKKTVSQAATISPPSVQYGGVCNSYQTDSGYCGDQECGYGDFPITGATTTGPGLRASELRSQACRGTSCPAQGGVPTSFDNQTCCDQDGDGYQRTICLGGTDCNDTPNTGYFINPGTTETCGDGIDNDCNSETSDTCPTPCEAQHGPGWFVGIDGRTCVPPECAFCYASGGTYCSQLGDCWTPVLIDIDGDGFDLTNAANGVLFKPDGANRQIRTAWTATNSDDAWLVLDRNNNGTIDNGTELFGCATPQPAPPTGTLKNGFLALAVYDKAENGGNLDRQIDARDAVFAQLKLWQDRNHNGVSEPNELQNIFASPIQVIELDFHGSRRTDEHGNKFRFRAKVKDAQGAQVGRWAWDVFPVAQN